MNKKRLTYAIIPFLYMLLLLFITYFGNQWYADTFGNPGVDYSYILQTINNAIPFMAWTIYPYLLAYLVWAATIFIVGYYSKRNLYNMMTVVTITFIICGLWWFFFQSDVESWRVTSGLFVNGDYLQPRTDLNFTESLVLNIAYYKSGPRNALPSMHCLISWICILGVRMDKKIPKGLVIFSWLINLMIIVSTQTTKQHYIIDTIVAVALAEVTFWLIKDRKFSKWLEGVFSSLNRKLKLEWDGIIK